MRINLQYIFIAHRYLYDHLKILHCDLSISNILLHRKDDESEPIGLLIDYDYSVNTVTASEAVNHQDTAVNAANTHTAEDALIGKRVVAASDAEIHLGAFEGKVEVEARKAPQRETPRTVRFAQLLEMSINHDL